MYLKLRIKYLLELDKSCYFHHAWKKIWCFIPQVQKTASTDLFQISTLAEQNIIFGDVRSLL